MEPYKVAKIKVESHKKFLKTWLKEHNVPFSFDDIWKLRA
jgi:hypothetical protein